MRHLVLWLLMALLAACAAPEKKVADEVIQRAAYSSGLPPSIAVITVINNRSGEGAHSALLVDASQRVLFDPAGSWYNRAAPERGDVHFGMTPGLLDFYYNYHARESFHVVVQTIPVSPQVAELALAEVKANGRVGAARCADSVTRIMRRLPGFEDTPQTFRPLKLMRALDKRPDVQTRKIFEMDSDDNKGLLAAVPVRTPMTDPAVTAAPGAVATPG